tara:strand:+ start:162 stop:986 length:825 start_codon:yes stop_codon:yes gene_type:complete
MKDNQHVVFLWTGKVEKTDFFYLCLQSLKLVSDCNIHVITPFLKEGSSETLNELGVNVIHFDRSLWDNRRIACKVERIQEFLFSLPDKSQLLVFDGDMLFLKDPFEAFNAPFDYVYTTRHYNYWAPTNAGCWGFRVNEDSKKFINFYADNMINPTWGPYVKWRLDHPHARGLQEQDWWIEQDFSSCIHINRDSVNKKGLGFDIITYDAGPQFNFIITTETPLNIQNYIKNKTSYVLHFKGSSFNRWVNGVNSKDELLKNKISLDFKDILNLIKK